MSIDLLPHSTCKRIIERIGRSIINLHQGRILGQREKDGSPMHPLKPKTIAKKIAKGAIMPEKRMICTEDFWQNAFEMNVQHDTLTIGVSKKLHKEGKVSYRYIAWAQLNSKYGKKLLRHPANPGADFFGLNADEMEEYRELFMEEAIMEIKKNFYEYLTKALKIK